jgi:hypothetical protein
MGRTLPPPAFRRIRIMLKFEAFIDFQLEPSIALLQSMPAGFNALLRELPEEWTSCSEGDGTWTVSYVVAHLVHCEATDWLRRARIILEFGESKPFAPLDREAARGTREGQPLAVLLDEFARLRGENLAALRAMKLAPEDMQRVGLHPAFGPVTLSQLLATWTTHDLTHLHQISRIMAGQYRDAVGPWVKYLGVLHCDGHSQS